MSEKALSRCALFLGLTPDELAFIIGEGKQYWVSENYTFFEMGDLNESMYVVLSGSVHIERPGTKADKKLRTLNPGALFGEMSFKDGSKTVTKVSSAEPTEVLELDSIHFSHILADQPELASKLWRNLGFEPKFLRRFEISPS